MIGLEVGAAPRAALVMADILRSRVSAISSRVRVFSIRYRFGPAPLPDSGIGGLRLGTQKGS
jgi:hypothetical protein